MRAIPDFNESLRKYGFSLFLALVSFAASYLSWPLMKSSPWFFCFAAIMTSAWFGGQSSSLVTTTVLVLLGRYFFIYPYGTFTLTRENSAPVIGFIIVSVFIGFLASTRRQAEAHRDAERSRFQATVMSLGEAVIATDVAGKITFMNGVAEQLTGWATDQAAGRWLDDVFVIVNGATRESVPTPVKAVMETGRVQGLANHTLLIGRDGIERPIDDSAAPIRDDRGNLTGVVLVFRDVTEKRQDDLARERRTRQLQQLAQIATRINSAHDVNSVIGIVTSEARNLIGVRQSAMSLVSSSNHAEPFSLISSAADQPSIAAPDAIDMALLLQLINGDLQPVRLSQGDLADDPRWGVLRNAALAFPTENGWLAARLVGRDGEPMGLLQLADKADGEFTEDDEAVLIQLLRFTAIAIENARLYAELRANDQRKDEFLAMLAHELRNPLAAISNAVDVTVHGGLEPNIDWAMDVINRQTKHLTRLIDDLLDVSRITRGKIELRMETVNATAILQSAVSTVKPLVEARRHTLKVEIDQNGLWIKADPTRLEQVVVNLLNNAAKYSATGGHIRLTAHLEGRAVVIGVADRGVGIPPEKLSDIFDLFTQGDRSLARSEGGLGIGLTVVKKLVELHGGSIKATSQGKDRGSEFSIRLPSAASPAQRPAEVIGRPEKSVQKTRILIVDDNADLVVGLRKLLMILGHEVATAHDGFDALAIARRFVPEFIMLDIGLPGMDGYEVASRLRREECCKDTIIVGISGYGQDEDRKMSRLAGFDHHLIKPIDQNALMALIADRASL